MEIELDIERVIKYLETYERNDMTLRDAIEGLKNARSLSDFAEPVQSPQGLLETT